MVCLNKDNEKYPYSSKLSKQKNAPFRGKFQWRLKMREIGSVADDLDVGAIPEGVFMHTATLGDTHFGEAGATRESSVPKQEADYRVVQGTMAQAQIWHNTTTTGRKEKQRIQIIIYYIYL